MIIDLSVETLKKPYYFWGLLLISNICFFIGAVIISHLWSLYFNHKKLPITKKDIRLAILIALLNILIAIPGYFLFTTGKITFTSTAYILDFILIFFGIDFLMYCFHLASHYIWPFKLIHKEHHTHHNFNAISLYVMHPLETVLFGLVLTLIPLIITINIYSFITFLFLNWFLGVIAHLNTKATKKPLFLGNNIFHKHHHEQPTANYGFYTVLWDKIFGTYFK